MIILPAIDIKDGQCVRLYQGDYDKVTTYAADPVQVAQRWQAAGASWLHIVDLDAAAQGQPVNLALIARIRAETSLHIELGGGLRTLTHIQQMLNLGIDRVILGTAALTNRALLQDALLRWDDAIVVGLDARAGRVAISGWRETSSIQATVLASELRVASVRRFIYTDIARDGTLQGPNLAALREMKQAVSRPAEDTSEPIGTAASLIASGGISSLDDLHALATLDIEGAIIGKALYTGTIDLATAISTFERT
jgi:phosphoribosylformimino-5-aminoimidazole carboxamide ribotide isomerase